ncbi:hypothetical protein DFH09DRAFT_1087384 [Mycena vulgaris]|nr:hypothetical protein DFH09DRAFT_1087384 [Mycena vulgaris]
MPLRMGRDVAAEDRGRWRRDEGTAAQVGKGDDRRDGGMDGEGGRTKERERQRNYAAKQDAHAFMRAEQGNATACSRWDGDGDGDECSWGGAEGGGNGWAGRRANEMNGDEDEDRTQGRMRRERGRQGKAGEEEATGPHRRGAGWKAREVDTRTCETTMGRQSGWDVRRRDTNVEGIWTHPISSISSSDMRMNARPPTPRLAGHSPASLDTALPRCAASCVGVCRFVCGLAGAAPTPLLAGFCLRPAAPAGRAGLASPLHHFRFHFPPLADGSLALKLRGTRPTSPLLLGSGQEMGGGDVVVPQSGRCRAGVGAREGGGGDGLDGLGVRVGL